MPKNKTANGQKSWSTEQHEKFLKEFDDIKVLWPRLTEREKKMVLHLTKSDLLSHDVNKQFEEKSTFSQKIADKITATFGSIEFAIFNGLFFIAWLVVNLEIIPGLTPFDPYPFGLLTTIVSLEAILLSIFVLMSQNQQGLKDRLMLNNDYFVNLRTEEELRKLADLLKAARFLEWSNEMYAIQKEQLELIKKLTNSSK